MESGKLSSKVSGDSPSPQEPVPPWRGEGAGGG